MDTLCFLKHSHISFSHEQEVLMQLSSSNLIFQSRKADMAQDVCQSQNFPHYLKRPESPLELSSLQRTAEEDKLRHHVQRLFILQQFSTTSGKEASLWLQFEILFDFILLSIMETTGIKISVQYDLEPFILLFFGYVHGKQKC